MYDCLAIWMPGYLRDGMGVSDSVQPLERIFFYTQQRMQQNTEYGHCSLDWDRVIARDMEELDGVKQNLPIY